MSNDNNDNNRNVICPKTFDDDKEYDERYAMCTGYKKQEEERRIDQPVINPKTKYYATIFFAFIVPGIIALSIFIFYVLRNPTFKASVLDFYIGNTNYPISIPGVIGATIALPPMSYIYILIMSFKAMFPSGDITKPASAFGNDYWDVFYDKTKRSSVSWIFGPTRESSSLLWALYFILTVLQLLLGFYYVSTPPY